MTENAVTDRKSIKAGKVTRPGELEAPLRDRVTDRMRSAILAGRYRPGERLVEDRLAGNFNVSRNPVREALRSLASEGLVVLTPRRGAAVAGFSLEEAREMIEVRSNLEGMNARLAARRCDSVMIEALRAVLVEGRAKAKSGAVEHLVRLNGRFHDLLAAAGHNRILADLMRSLRERTNLVFAPMSARGAAQNWAEHAAILEAVIARDEELAALLASRHVLRAGQRYLAAVGAEVGSGRAASSARHALGQ